MFDTEAVLDTELLGGPRIGREADQQTGKPRPPQALVTWDGGRDPETNSRRRPKAPPGQVSLLERYPGSRRYSYGLAGFMLGFMFVVLTLIAGGFSWMTEWVFWLIVPLGPLLMFLGVVCLVGQCPGILVAVGGTAELVQVEGQPTDLAGSVAECGEQPGPQLGGTLRQERAGKIALGEDGIQDCVRAEGGVLSYAAPQHRFDALDGGPVEPVLPGERGGDALLFTGVYTLEYGFGGGCPTEAA